MTRCITSSEPCIDPDLVPEKPLSLCDPNRTPGLSLVNKTIMSTAKKHDCFVYQVIVQVKDRVTTGMATAAVGRSTGKQVIDLQVP